jgi:uncharacterized protein
MNTVNFTCIRCGNTQYALDEFCAPRNYLAGMFSLHTMKFTTLSCSRCGYTEVFKGRKKEFEQAVVWFNRPMH